MNATLKYRSGKSGSDTMYSSAAMYVSSSWAFLASSSVSGPGMVTANSFSLARLPGVFAIMPWMAISGMTTRRTREPSQLPTMTAVSMNSLMRRTFLTPSPACLTANVRGETATTAYGSIMRELLGVVWCGVRGDDAASEGACRVVETGCGRGRGQERVDPVLAAGAHLVLALSPGGVDRLLDGHLALPVGLVGGVGLHGPLGVVDHLLEHGHLAVVGADDDLAEDPGVLEALLDAGEHHVA